MHSIIKTNFKKINGRPIFIIIRSVYRCHHFYNKNQIFYIFCIVISEIVGLASGLRFFSQYFVVM